MRGLAAACLLAACKYDPSPISNVPTDSKEPDEQVPPEGVAGRVTAGLIGLWGFDEGTGNLVTDTSGGVAVNATISDPGQVVWGTGTLTVNSPVDINSGFGVQNRLISSCQGSDAVTLEVWVSPANTSQTGTIALQPARIVAMSPANAGNHEISIGQLGPNWAGQVRTSNPGTDVHGGPILTQPIVGSLSHLVVTADGTGRRFYVNGTKVEDVLGGNLDLWDKNHVIELAGDPAGKNPWLGTLHLVAMYNRALDDADVMTNFVAGP